MPRRKGLAMAKISKAEREEAIKSLQEILRKGDTILAICRNWNRRSGSSRWTFHKIDKRGNRYSLTYNMARACGFTLRDSEISFPYLNMDPAFHAVYTLGRTLFPSKHVTCKRCNGTGRGTLREYNAAWETDPTQPRYIETADAPGACRECSGTGKAHKDGGYSFKSERL